MILLIIDTLFLAINALCLFIILVRDLGQTPLYIKVPVACIMVPSIYIAIDRLGGLESGHSPQWHMFAWRVLLDVAETALLVQWAWSPRSKIAKLFSTALHQ